MQDDKMKITLDEPTLVMLAKYAKNIEGRLVAQMDQLTEYFEQATDLQEIAEIRAKLDELNDQLINVRHIMGSVDNRTPDSLIVPEDGAFPGNKLIKRSEAAHLSVLLHFATCAMAQLEKLESDNLVNEDHPLAKVLPFSDAIERLEMVANLNLAAESCQLILGQTPNSTRIPYLTQPLDTTNQWLMSEIEYIEECVFEHFSEAFIKNGIDEELVHSLFEMYQVEKMPASINWPVIFSGEIMVGFYPMLRQYLGSLDGPHHFTDRSPAEEVMEAPERDLTEDEADELSGKLFVASHCATEISKLLTGKSRCGLETSMSPIKEHLQRVRVYGTTDRWIELASLASVVAKAITNHRGDGRDPAITLVMDTLEMLKPDFQANPEVMLRLYRFDKALTGGAELRAFGIEGELPIG